ncbi:amidohydrolase family protein [Aridibaculum aurantiacum]|uniref:amidohydrolase family protein n=1 Tax=Aridibaculum aurantiacum TaxID=2810307 RepID=UPI001A96349A|nr:amidohydrolase family protein [Aridibaculum aurantiacum]
MKKLLWGLAGLWLSTAAIAQETYPVNGVADRREGAYAFTNATIVKDPQTTLRNATLVIRDGKIVSVGTGVSIPADAVVVDCKDKFIYPSFIDIFSDYGVPAPQRPAGAFNYNAPAQLTSNQKGAYSWNQAIKTDVDAVKLFSVDEAKAKQLRDVGFGTVLTHQKDGIARGTGVLATLQSNAENLVILKDRASAHYSFSKGSSTQSYPSSLMGTIALLRQSYLDAQWYKNKPAKEGLNISLQAWNDQQALPQIFDANDKWQAARADRIGDEFGVQYIIKAGGNEYQRINEMAATKAPFILSLDFPQPQDLEDPNDARFVSLTDMKHWEMAPSNPAAFEKANIPFAITAADLRDQKTFLVNLRKAINYGLSETKALDALTKAPATMLGVYNTVGSLDAGKIANFIITSGPVFAERTNILSNWVQGAKYSVKEDNWKNIVGTYNFTVNSATGAPQQYKVDVRGSSTASLIAKDTIAGKFSFDGNAVRFNFAPEKNVRTNIRLSGFRTGDQWQGTGVDTAGNPVWWTAALASEQTVKGDSAKDRRMAQTMGDVVYPFTGFGLKELPKQETILIRNATVWTNEKDGVLQGADVLIRNGKIARVGKGLAEPGARVIDGTGKHVTPGIIDEHSHIAAASINEGAQSVTSEVRVGDNLNPEDINIYRQLSGGVTTSHILHGSANTIGGQTQLIKLRWGANDEGLKFANADPFIKFALGENVKRTSSNSNNRFPDTRMGVEQVLDDAFARARDYERALKGKDAKNVRRDLELDALVEILNKKRFITCHSYVQSEINSAMKIGEKYGFPFNTFTHILEGYKVADKMKAHGAHASTFSDWWQYKMEVVDAIPYNATLMNRVGVNVAINSDDAEMARRLNQEAAKSVKYGGMSEEDALKMVTLNPAIMMHVADRVGSLKAGKDADVVVWSDHPLSIYAKAETTIVDGAVYFDRAKDAELRKQVAAERNRLIKKFIGEKKPGAGNTQPPAVASMEYMHTCSDHAHSHGLLVVDAEEAALYNN